MKASYKIALITILILFASLVCVLLGYQKYQEEKEKTMAMINVKDGLSINYLNGNKIVTNEDTYQLDFSITNSMEKETQYYIRLLNRKVNDTVSYQLISKNNESLNKQDSIEKTKLANLVKINMGETHSYSLIIYNIEIELSIDIDTIDNSLKSMILQNNEVKKTSNISFQDGSTSNDGLIEYESEDGTGYYFRGSIENNYVSFADLMWRIVRINPDGTVLMVLNNLIEEDNKFFENNENETTSFLESNVYQTLTNWYDTMLNDKDSYVASSRYCTDDNALKEENGTIYYLADERIFTNFSPVYSCHGTSNSSKIGLLTADDVMLAGANNLENKSYYLYNESVSRDWWTLTLNKKENGHFNYIGVSKYGMLLKDEEESKVMAIRPAITLIKKLKVTGNGTIDNPYQVELI